MFGKEADSKLRKAVKDRFGVAMPKWRKTQRDGASREVRVFSRAERREMAALIDWLTKDSEYRADFDVYFAYCDIMRLRGYGSPGDAFRGRDRTKWQDMIRRNFAKCAVERIYYEMCCDPATVLGEGSGDGYWIYLDRPYLDISHMEVGDAILDLDEVWAMTTNVLGDWQHTCCDREALWTKHSCYQCDRCGKSLWVKDGSRFDAYENLLHCGLCVATCSSHWSDTLTANESRLSRRA